MSLTKDTLGRAIMARRAEMRLTRRAAARVAHISYPYLSELEQGVKYPSMEKLVAIAEALDLTPAQLLTRAEELNAD